MKFTWEAHCTTDDWTDRPLDDSGEPILFDTQEKCYNQMRSAALNKMKWNTEFDDFDSDSPIVYTVKFFPNKIVHTSYSGEYVYEILQVRG